jgi:hypothetical protein
MQQPPQYPSNQPYYVPPQPPKTPEQKRRDRIWIGCILAVVVLCSIFSLANASNSKDNITTANATGQTSPVATPTATTTDFAMNTPTREPTPTPVPPIQYPPKTLADLRGLAAKGNASVIHPFEREKAGMAGVCPQPKVLVTVDPGIKDRQLAEDLLAYFYDAHIDSPCGAIVFVYHNKSESNDVFTAGRIKFDVTDASGQANFDPNATNVTHELTLDIGSLDGQEYVVTY